MITCLESRKHYHNTGLEFMLIEYAKQNNAPRELSKAVDHQRFVLSSRLADKRGSAGERAL